MSIGYSSGRVSCATRQHHWQLDSEYKRGPIPRLIWNDGHSEWSRWYWFKDKHEHIIRGYYAGFK